MKIFSLLLFMIVFSGCLSTAPISVAWRSNSNMQTASTEAKNDNSEQSPAVNADKRTEVESAVSTASGTATTKEGNTQKNTEEGN